MAAAAGRRSAKQAEAADLSVLRSVRSAAEATHCRIRREQKPAADSARLLFAFPSPFVRVFCDDYRCIGPPLCCCRSFCHDLTLSGGRREARREKREERAPRVGFCDAHHTSAHLLCSTLFAYIHSSAALFRPCASLPCRLCPPACVTLCMSVCPSVSPSACSLSICLCLSVTLSLSHNHSVSCSFPRLLSLPPSKLRWPATAVPSSSTEKIYPKLHITTWLAVVPIAPPSPQRPRWRPARTPSRCQRRRPCSGRRQLCRWRRRWTAGPAP